MTADVATGLRTYRCPVAGRWLPRVLASSVLASALVVGYRVDPAGVGGYSRGFRIALVVAAAMAALWLVRRGGEVRLTVTPAADHLEFRCGGRRATLAYADVRSLGYAPAFGPSRSWLPALILLDRDEQVWRIPATVGRGAELVREIVSRSGRSDLGAWADARRLPERMARASRRIVTGYVVAALVLCVAAGYALR